MANDLITRAEYKAYTGITGNAQDAAIDVVIPRISELIKNFCRRRFNDYVDEAKVETFNGNIDRFYMREYPVISVISLETSDDYGQNYTDMVEYTDFVWNVEDDSILTLNSDGVFPSKPNGYKVSYYAGFDPLPEDIKLAAFDLTSYYLKNEAVTHLVRSPSSSIMQLEYITTATFPVHIARVLNLYKASWD